MYFSFTDRQKRNFILSSDVQPRRLLYLADAFIQLLIFWSTLMNQSWATFYEIVNLANSEVKVNRGQSFLKSTLFPLLRSQLFYLRNGWNSFILYFQFIFLTFACMLFCTFWFGENAPKHFVHRDHSSLNLANFSRDESLIQWHNISTNDGIIL